MSIDDKTIIGALRALDDHGGGEAPVARLVSRGRAARTRRRATMLGSTTAGIVGLATVLAVTGGAHKASSAPGATSLAMAAQATAETSFHVVATTHFLALPASWDLVMAGDWDPVHHDGYLTQVSHGSFASGPDVREVAGVCYPMRDTANAWTKYDGDCFTNNFDSSPNALMYPDELLKQIEDEGSAKLVSRTGSGADEIDTWSFSWHVAGRRPGLGSTSVGTAKVEAATGYVTELTWSVTDDDGGRDSAGHTVVFSDFGKQVTVTAPPVVPFPSYSAEPVATGTPDPSSSH